MAISFIPPTSCPVDQAEYPESKADVSEVNRKASREVSQLGRHLHFSSAKGVSTSKNVSFKAYASGTEA